MRFACGRLLSDAPFKQISVELGYRDPAHFCYTFHRFFGVTPNQMRGELRKRIGRSALMSHFRNKMSENGK